MQVKPEELRKIIAAMRLDQLRADHKLEHYEAVAADAPLCVRGQMLYDIARLRERNKEVRAYNKQRLEALEQYLAEDEAANWWKGEDRNLCEDSDEKGWQ